ncbi:MAG TPA: orotate phosphoribosyltransferase [Bacillota bacterium]|nr:orotate phosphoribosyltransferase [Bacillota bacterium]
MESYKQEFIEFMVRANVLTFGNFKTKSGRMTPYFLNTGRYKTGEQIAKLGEFYAQCIVQHLKDDFNVLYGPAYKGIPLAVTTAIALYGRHGLDIPYCFNRKEAKDHGEGGNIIGHSLAEGDRVLIVEDVITAGTSVRESIPLLQSMANLNVTSLVVSVDRMEKGVGEKTALNEVREEFGLKVQPIVTIDEIVTHLYNREIDGKVVIDAAMKAKIEEYRSVYGG